MQKLITIEAVILLLQIIMYYGCELFQHDYRDVRRGMDDKIPFIPEFALVYLLWFPLIALYPISLYPMSAYYYTVYQISILVSIFTTTIIYVLFPTKFERPEPENHGAGRLMRVIYSCSFKGSNCSPSLHCIQCFIITTSALLCPQINRVPESFIVITSAMIVLSTLMTKQHALRDMATAIPAAMWSYAAGFLITNHFGFQTILSAVGIF